MPDGALIQAPKPGMPRAFGEESQSWPMIAIVIPLFKHPELVNEAIVSALAQQGRIRTRIVVVNDGCPFPASYKTAMDFSRAYPDRVAVIRRANGGLSAARNTGIDFALEVWPEVRAIYLLDADNRLYPDFLTKCWDVLDQDGRAGWVYPDIDMFGEEHNYDVGGDYSVLQHLVENTCEAGSLVRADLLRDGFRFDETMRLGFEDWDFWLQLAGAGHRGVHGPSVGFRYRKRRESMLRNSERDRQEILGYMRRKHKKLYAPGNLLRIEHDEAPRYAILLADQMMVALTSDPTRLERLISLESFRVMLRAARLDPRRYPCPSHFVVTHATFMAYLGRLKLTNWAFWRLEESLDTNNVAVAAALNDGEAQSVAFSTGSSGHRLHSHRRAGLVMIAADLLAACLADRDPSWTSSLSDEAPQPVVFELKIDAVVPPQQAEIWTGGVGHFLASFRALHDWWNAAPPEQGFAWREAVVLAKPKLPLASRELLQAGPIFPMVAHEASRHVGFILPVAQFGGVEKVARAVARELREAGWIPHLFVFEARCAGDLDELTQIFETINFLDDPEIGSWTPDGRYFGAGFTGWATGGRHGRALGLLAGMNAVVNCQSADAHGIMGECRRMGIVTIAHLHLIDSSRHGQPVGFVYQTLGYEHCYDQILVISEKLRDGCLALGMPAEKLMLLRNAPSYPIEPATVDAVVMGRGPITGRKLRCLFAGRFDRQKGLHRVAHLVQITRDAGLDIDWRIVGGQILSQEDAAGELAPIAHLVEGAIREPDGLTELYGWADVLVLPSHFEGVPLTILEAMRLGVVPLATDVGAVAEVVDDQTTGFLFRNGDDRVLMREMVMTLQRLKRDPELLTSISIAAANRARAWTWPSACKPLLEFLAAKCPVLGAAVMSQ